MSDNNITNSKSAWRGDKIIGSKITQTPIKRTATCLVKNEMAKTSYS